VNALTFGVSISIKFDGGGTQQSPLQLSYCNCLIAAVFCAIVSVAMLFFLGFWLQLLASFIVIMDDCVVAAAAAAFAFVVVTVALF
jgi:hypothetical protein